jgi:hypothetical protein
MLPHVSDGILSPRPKCTRSSICFRQGRPRPRSGARCQRSTGSGRSLAARPGTQLIAATDVNSQGAAFANRLREIAEAAGSDWLRLTPRLEDWIDALKAKVKEEKSERDPPGRAGLGGGAPAGHQRRRGGVPRRPRLEFPLDRRRVGGGGRGRECRADYSGEA